MTKDERTKLRQALLYLADCLAAVNDMTEMHNCNDCEKTRVCPYAPMPGMPVRWNCPLWEERK